MTAEEEGGDWVPPSLDWRPITKTVRGAVWGARFLAAVFSFLWITAILGHIHQFNMEMTNTPDSVPIKTHVDGSITRLDVYLGRTYHGWQYPYELMTYELDKNETTNGGGANDQIVIPILYIPGTESPSSQALLAEAVHNRTKNTAFRYQWYAIDFVEEPASIDGKALDNQMQYVTVVVNYLTTMYSDRRIVLLGYQSGGVLAAGFVAGIYYDHIAQTRPQFGVNKSELADLVLLEAAPVTKPGVTMDWETWKFYQQWRTLLDESIDQLPTGIVSFNGGVKDFEVHPSWTKLRGATHIPVWAIDDVADAGLRESHMLHTSVPFLTHLADLLVFYGHNYHKMDGKEIVRAFYEQLDRERISRLPEVWNATRIAGERDLETGYRNEFLMSGKQWLRIRLERDEYIRIRVHSKCLTSATLIRSLKHIVRKNSTVLYDYLEFAVYDARPHEDIRLLLDAPGECHVTIETTPWWHVYAHRLYRGFFGDEHAATVGRLICATWLVVLEGQKLGSRTDQHVEMLVVITGATLVQMFTRVYGTRMEGLIFGFGSLMVVYFAIGAVFTAYLRLMKRCIDRYYFSAFLETHFNWIFVMIVAVALGSASVGVGLFVLFYAALVGRPFYVFVFIFPLYPLFSKWSQSHHVATDWKVMGTYDQPTRLMIHLVVCCALSIFLRFERLVIPRYVIHTLAYAVFFVQACAAYWPLELHLAISLFVLVVAERAVHHTPKQMLKWEVSLKMLDIEQYAFLESRNT